ncbi:hypothetical protein [Paludisphaera sp.]|uniref:hypothetical protein n=1 Tax=Paludisphaera sp. TaxID=2017432 RepID=UPI00301C8F2E
MRRSRRLLATAPLAACLAFTGCAEELGPEVIPRTTAEGVVLISGRPVDRGWVELQPIDGTLGDITSARLRPDGSFRFDRAPVGEVAIRLVDVPLGSTGAYWIFRNNSPIRRSTQTPPGPPITIEIVEELMRYQEMRGGSR